MWNSTFLVQNNRWQHPELNFCPFSSSAQTKTTDTYFLNHPRPVKYDPNTCMPSGLLLFLVGFSNPSISYDKSLIPRVEFEARWATHLPSCVSEIRTNGPRSRAAGAFEVLSVTVPTLSWPSERGEHRVHVVFPQSGCCSCPEREEGGPKPRPTPVSADICCVPIRLELS